MLPHRLQFSEYQLSLTKEQISELAKVSIESVLQSLFNDTLRVLQAVMGCISIERMDPCFSDYIAQVLAPSAVPGFSLHARSRSVADTAKSSSRNCKFSMAEIQEMIQASNRNAEKSKTMAATPGEENTSRQHDPLLDVAVLRRKKEGE